MEKVEKIRPADEMYMKANKIIRDCEDCLIEVRNFEPEQYLTTESKDTLYEGFDRMKQIDELVTLLISLKEYGATMLERASVIKHSMVIAKTNALPLDWRKSEIDNDIQCLKNKYLCETTQAWFEEGEK